MDSLTDQLADPAPAPTRPVLMRCATFEQAQTQARELSSAQVGAEPAANEHSQHHRTRNRG